MSDQPVTPDREALIDALRLHWSSLPTRELCAGAVDALLPLLTEALDRARQQGREEMRAEERHHLALLITAEAHAVEGTEREDSAQGLRCAARLMRAADRKAINE